MSWTRTMAAAVVAAAGFAAAGCATKPAQTKPATAAPAAKAAPDKPMAMPSEEEMMKMMMEMGTPAPEHKKLAAMAGTWDTAMTMFEPGKPPQTFPGVVQSWSVMNGLYVTSTHTSNMGGMPFEGHGVDGYSKEKKKYFAFWADSMGSTPMLLWGTADASGRTVTYDGEVYDCGPMGQMTPRVKITHDDDDHMTFEFWAKMGGAPDYMKMMEGKYTRRK